MPSVRAALVALCVLSPAAAGFLRGADERPTALTTDAPIINFSVPTFTKEGFRSWLLRGSEGLFVGEDQIAVTNLNLTVFTGDASDHVDAVFLSPTATAFLHEARVRGPGRVRLINDDLEATGEDWSYDHRQKKVSIRKSVHVVFHAELKDVLR
ncbi:MAG TPA: hypothetical protein VLW52_04850 [Opitutaceae bacterium]|nr:hypothetical protein [Opitutaceae bacterium]